MRKRALILSVCLSAAASAAPFSNLFFFGDSLSDTGNVYAATSLVNSITFGLFPIQPASPPYFNGRFSNGPLWSERVAERLGQAGDAVNAGLSLGVFGSLPGTGNNYAVGGARTGGGGALGILDALVPTGITAQVNYYLSTRTPEAGALYLFSGGGNDLRDAAALSTSAARISAAESAADTLIFTIYSLYQAGGRNFFITNGPNVGFIPEAVNGGTFAQGIEASVAFNNRLFFWATVLDTFPGFELAFFDLYSFYNSVFIDTYAFGGAQYGFTSATIPCYPGTPGAKACDVSLFFDDIHPTAKLHRLFGDQAADLILSKWPDAIPNPEPSTILLTSSALLIGWRLARRRRA